MAVGAETAGPRGNDLGAVGDWEDLPAGEGGGEGALGRRLDVGVGDVVGAGGGLEFGVE